MSTTVCAAAQEIPPGYFLADCAVSGGCLRDFLRAAMDACGGRLCLRLAPVYMDFPLPCPSGRGQALTARELKARYGGEPCHVSRSLCTEYFTQLREGQAHVVLFDTLQSLREKYRAAAECDVPLVLVEDPALRRQLG